ncbi:MAG: hypothetical protein JKY46_01760 [Robiginitomaculum sp.]|nr:hypothetical protein [Robiginitomaculum sp.]
MEPFKNSFSPALVSCLADHLHLQVSGFDRAEFEAPILANLQELELKQRAQLIADQVHLHLPEQPAERARILLAILHPDELDHANQPSDEHGVCGWAIFALQMVVGQHGLGDFDRSMEVLRQMSKRFSSEFGIRYFLLADQVRALAIMQSWLGDPNRHVRRLVSEGSRPRLPWAMQLAKLVADPEPIMGLLHDLRDDKEEYVRRSVANNLNDIAKDHPDLVGDLAVKWMNNAKPLRQKLVRHACRTLIKQGHVTALEAFGIFAPNIELLNFKIDTKIINLGEKMQFDVELLSNSTVTQDLIIDYILHFKKANGKLAPKVFKWSKFTLAGGQGRKLSKAHPIRKITTRKYYGGVQGLSLRINGQDFGYQEFELKV